MEEARGTSGKTWQTCLEPLAAPRACAVSMVLSPCFFSFLSQIDDMADCSLLGWHLLCAPVGWVQDISSYKVLHFTEVGLRLNHPVRGPMKVTMP